MSGRPQALMRTRCPACATVFRVTSEQLRLKAGKVRCGQCQTVFNAFDEFLADEAPVTTTQAPLSHPAAPTATAATAGEPVYSAAADISPPQLADSPVLADDLEEEADAAVPAETHAEAIADADERTAGDFGGTRQPAGVADDAPGPAYEEASESPAATHEAPIQPAFDDAATVMPEAVSVTSADDRPAADVEATVETPEQSTEAARQAGLVAARELSEGPAYNRWAAGTLADVGGIALGAEGTRRALWPFIVVSLLLLLTLGAQFVGHFRTEVVRWWPAAESYYEMAGLSVALPRNAEMVAIEASDLQADNARGLFVLQATLHNRAAYAQDWPALELTLTDAADSVVARKVMLAADYLPPAISPERFPANGEVAVRLWLEARNLGAAGYRLYVFYP